MSTPKKSKLDTAKESGKFIPTYGHLSTQGPKSSEIPRSP